MRSALPFNDSELMDFWNQSFESAMIALLGVKTAAECGGSKSRAEIHERDQTRAVRTQGVALHEATAMRNLACRAAAYLNPRFDTAPQQRRFAPLFRASQSHR